LPTISVYQLLFFVKFCREVLAAGSSYPWPQILYKLTGERELRVDAMLEYFEPLLTWLKSERERIKYPIGWKKSNVPVGRKSEIVSADIDKPIFLKNSSDVGLSYVRAIKKESKLMQANKPDHSSGQKSKADSTSFSVSQNGLTASKENTQSRSVLGPLGQTKSSILTRPVFVPSTGKDPLTLVKKNDENRYSSKLYG
jgi:hypothetical protein